MGSLDPLPAGRTGIRARCPSSPGPLVAGACGHVLHAQKGRLHGKRGSASHRKSKIPVALRPRRAPRADRRGRAVQPPCSLAGLHGTQRGGRRPGPGPARASEPRRLKAGPEQAPASVREAEAVAVPVDAGPAVPTGSFDDSVPPHTRTPRPEEVERQAHGPQLVRRAAAATGSACGGRSLLADRWRSQRVQGTTARPGADASRPRARVCVSARTWRACGPRCGAGRTPLSVSANLGGSGRKLQGRLARSAPLARTPAPSGQLPPGLHGPGRARLPRRGGLACLWELCDPDPSPLAQRLSQVTCEAHTCCGALAQALPPPSLASSQPRDGTSRKASRTPRSGAFPPLGPHLPACRPQQTGRGPSVAWGVRSGEAGPVPRAPSLGRGSGRQGGAQPQPLLARGCTHLPTWREFVLP